MKRVTGIGGVFFKTANPESTKAWYEKHLGIPAGQYGHLFIWRDDEQPDQRKSTTWNPFSATTNYFAPSTKEWMINYRVENLKALLDELRKEGVTIVGDIEEYEYGKFGWILDPEGNKIELWEPVDTALNDSSQTA
jgi:predicted enzyme related to lactoylglutathione lyase